jgi:hypothetical protein
MADEEYTMTEKGWTIAIDIYRRFVFEHEDIELIAADYGMEVVDIAVLMSVALMNGLDAMVNDD